MRHPTWLKTTLLLIIPLLVASAGAAPLDADKAEAFIRALVDHPDSMDQFISPDDLKTAHRLGISYPEAPCKPLISWDLSPTDIERLQKDGTAGSFAIEKLEGGHSRLVLFPEEEGSSRRWVFKDGKVVSSILHRVRDWQQIESEHFRFFISDTTRFHPENIVALESFLMKTAALLQIPDSDMKRLAREKIYYCFCSSQDEIRELTGYSARGMYVVSHDIVVSTYSAHFHELAHLLINFRLQRPHLYTHPFFLEGFAVAIGGRGGKTPDILHQLGLSIHRSGWVSLDELLDADGFYRLNASMSYPGSAPYNRFLLEVLGAAEYLELYRRYGGKAEAVMQMKVAAADLPDEGEWIQFLENQPTEGAVKPGAPGIEAVPGPTAFYDLAGGDDFGFLVPGTTLTTAGPAPAGYRSFLFEEFFENEPYAGQRYYIRASIGEVAVYDLFTNTMVALYASGFSSDPVDIPAENGRFQFQVDRSVFANEMKEIENRFIEE